MSAKTVNGAGSADLRKTWRDRLNQLSRCGSRRQHPGTIREPRLKYSSQRRTGSEARADGSWMWYGNNRIIDKAAALGQRRRLRTRNWQDCSESDGKQKMDKASGPPGVGGRTECWDEHRGPGADSGAIKEAGHCSTAGQWVSWLACNRRGAMHATPNGSVHVAAPKGRSDASRVSPQERGKDAFVHQR